MLIGIDGGGSKTAGILIDETGTIHARHTAGACFFVGSPDKETRTFLKTFAEEIYRQAGVTPDQIQAACLGLNGIDFVDELPVQLQAVSQALTIAPHKIRLVNDGIIALAGASMEPRSMIIQHGSGSTTAWRTSIGNEVIYDCLGVGQIADIRYDLQRLVARMIEGRHQRTPLVDAALQHYACTEQEYAEACYRGTLSNKKIVSTVPLIMDAWQQKDAAADILVQRQVREYCLTAYAMAVRMGTGPHMLTLGGGVFKGYSTTFMEYLHEHLHDHLTDLTINTPICSPQIGACILAASFAHHNPLPIYQACLEKG